MEVVDSESGDISASWIVVSSDLELVSKLVLVTVICRSVGVSSWVGSDVCCSPILIIAL